MKRRTIMAALGLALAAAVTAAVTAPAEVVDNLDFFSDFELLNNLDVLEDDPAAGGAEVSTSAAGQVEISTATVAVSTAAAEGL